MTKTKPAAVLIAGTVLLLAGCGGGQPETSEPTQSTATTGDSSDGDVASEREDVLGASMHHALDKAEAVEDQVMQQKKDIDAALDAAEGNTDDE
jgi:hypothetical protein